MNIYSLIKHSIITFCVLLASLQAANATHLMGGELTYEYDGSTSGASFYNIRLIVYRYCDTTVSTPAPLDAEMFLGIYTDDSVNTGTLMNWYNTEILSLVSSTFVTSAAGNSNCPFQPTACIERGEYILTVLLPDNAVGYHLLVERCCRNGNIVNLTFPGDAGMSYYAFIPPGIINSTPQIADISVPYICTSDTISIINNAYDPDGDSLAYSFVVPFSGNSSSVDPIPDPMVNTPYVLPISNVNFAPGYSQSNIFGPGGYANIDPVTGLTQYYIPNQGFYVAAIEIREYRNGVLISSIRRDLQFISIPCTPNALPVLSSNNPVGGVYSVPEGQQLCFNISYSDPDGDSLFLTSAGALLDPAITNPVGVLPDATGDSVVTSQFCWTPVCGMSRPAPYQFSVTVKDNGCPEKVSNQIFSVYVTAGTSALTPTVSVGQSPPGIICTGSQVSFVANGTLTGTNPQYTWFVNGTLASTGDSVFTPANLNDGDEITVTMISNATCLVTNTANSPPFVVNINPQPAPTVNITSNPATTLCPQQICLFTANVTNTGASPDYQWYINGVPSGTNQPAFTAGNPSGTMAVFVTLSPSTGCPPQNSNTIVFNIQPYLAPQINMTASVTDSICPGQPVTFYVNSSNTGTAPVYNWLLNGAVAGNGNDTLVLTSLNDGDEVNVTVTSSYPCLSPAYTYADPLVYYHYASLSADLTDGPLEICLGEPVNLTLATQGGWSATYAYNWSYGNSVTALNSIFPQSSGYYYASVDDYCFAAVSDSLYIEVLPVPESDFTWEPLKPTIFEPFVQFYDASYGAVSWSWNLGEQVLSDLQNPSHEYESGGIFPITLITTNDVGCTDTLVKELEVENFITAYVPNSFTPNGDGKNDLFGLSGFSTGGYSMKIFNRWGQLVFDSIGPYDSWNGSDTKGKPAPSGSYVYLIRLNNDTSQKPITGAVTLVR